MDPMTFEVKHERVNLSLPSSVVKILRTQGKGHMSDLAVRLMLTALEDMYGVPNLPELVDTASRKIKDKPEFIGSVILDAVRPEDLREEIKVSRLRHDSAPTHPA